MTMLFALVAPAVPALAAGISNDDLQSFAPLNLPGRESPDLAAATVQSGEPSPCGQIANTAWYAIRMASATRLTAATSNTTTDTAIAVYEAPLEPPTFGSLRLLDCNDDMDFLITQSEVSWSARPGYAYYIQLGVAKGGAGGPVGLRVDPAQGYGPNGPARDPDLPAGATSVVLESGNLRLGVNDTGNLVARNSRVGLQYMPTGNDALNPGCPCEGWGLLDEASGAHGSIGESSGRTGNLRLHSFQVDGNRSAVSVVDVGGVMRVRQKVRPALGSPDLFELAIEVTNMSTTPQLPLYRRTMDWDIGPTVFNEYVTIAGAVGGTRGDEPKVVYTSDDGFASPDPVDGRSFIISEGTFTDSGPEDHGALIDIALPKLQPGATSTFSIYYGAAGNEHDITQALLAAGSAVYSTASPSSPGGLEDGTPNTFGFGFRLHDSRYVALGDSFQSGEGAPAYEPGTATDDTGGTPENRCHRSLKAYPQLVFDTPGTGQRFTFSACSGATIATLYDRDGKENGPPWNENAQIDDVGGDATLVTIGIGGNDVEFANTLQECILANVTRQTPCNDTMDAQVTALIDGITQPEAGVRLSRLQKAYSDLRKRAPRARILVMGYPRFFRSGNITGGCAGVRPSDQLWINEKIRQFDEAIRSNVTQMGLDYVDTYDLPEGHELCSDVPIDEEFLNGIVPLNKEHSYHPKTYGHARIAEAVLNQLHNGVEGDARYTMTPNQRIYGTQNVPTGSTGVTVSAGWPGSDIDLSLMSPSGVVYSRRTSVNPDDHDLGPTYERWTIPNPEPGVWQIRLHAVDVNEEGEQVTLRAGTTLVANQPPVASFTHTIDGRTLTLDATGSSDPDGAIADYTWDLGDVVLRGPRVTYTFSEDGEKSVALVVTDDAGAKSFDSHNGIMATSRRYTFDGFRPPVNDDNVNTVQAGQAIPFKFALRNAEGEQVTGASALKEFTFDGTGAGAEFQLTHDGKQCVLVAKTPKAWAGTTRTFTLRLDDGTRHTATFAFR